jgi:hypothetical protein
VYSGWRQRSWIANVIVWSHKGVVR